MNEQLGGRTEVIEDDSLSEIDDYALLMEAGVIESEESWETKLDALEARYAGRIFTYKNYSGTVRDLVGCPEFAGHLEMGVDEASSWIETHDGTPEDAEEEEVVLAPEDILEQSDDDAKETISQQNVAPEEEHAMAKEVDADVGVREEVPSAETTEAVMEATTPTQQVATEKSEIVENVSAIDIDRGDTRQEAAADDLSTAVDTPEANSSIVLESKIIETVEIDQPPLPDLSQEIVVAESEEVGELPESVTVAAVAEADEVFYVPRSESVVVEIIDQPTTQIIDEAVMAEQLVELGDEIEQPMIVLETATNAEVQTEIINEDAELDAAVVEWSEFDDEAEEGVYEYEDNNVIEFPVTQIDASDETDEQPKQRSLTESITEDETEIVIATVAHEIERLVGEAPVAAERAVDDNAERVVEEVDVIIRNIEVLQQATTAEECKEAVAELRVAIEKLLEDLGYEEPEQLTKELLEKYGDDLETLHDIMMRLLDQTRPNLVVVPSTSSRPHHPIGRHVVSRLIDLIRVAPASPMAA